MLGKSQTVNVDVSNSANIYNALSYMTVGRAENRGTLQVALEGGDVKLKCANHHFLTRRNNFTDVNGANAAALRELVVKAVVGELDKVFDNLKANALEADRKNIDDRCEVLKNQFLADITWNDGFGTSESLSRKAIGKILENVEALKENLCVTSLLKMSAEELTSLADGGKNSQSLRKAKECRQDEIAALKHQDELKKQEIARKFQADLETMRQNAQDAKGNCAIEGRLDANSTSDAADLFEIRTVLRRGVDATKEFHGKDGKLTDKFLMGEFKNTLAEQCRGKDFKAYVSFAVNFFDEYSMVLKNAARGMAMGEYFGLVAEVKDLLSDPSKANAGNFMYEMLNEKFERPVAYRDTGDATLEQIVKENKNRLSDVELTQLKVRFEGRSAIYKELSRVFEIACQCYRDANPQIG